MITFKSDVDFYKGAGEYFKSQKRDRVDEILEWLKVEIEKALNERNFEKADSHLASIKGKVEYENSNIYNNPKLYEYCKEWILKNFDLIEKIAFSNSKRDSIYIFIKFARYKSYKELIEVAILIYQTLKFKENYQFIKNIYGQSEKSPYIINLALVGMYRYGYQNLAKHLIDEEIQKFDEENLKASHKNLYDEIEAFIQNDEYSIEYLTFIALSDSNSLFKDKIKERIEEIKELLKELIEENITLQEERESILIEMFEFLDSI